MNFYNEHDPKAAAWLRELIVMKLIPDGTVEERSMVDLKPEDLHGYKQHHFFAGIAGWPEALRLSGVPEDYPIWTGSCPCQPFSAAGKGLGTDDERHLWPAWFKLIDALRPPLIFGEQVASKAALGWLDGVFADLESPLPFGFLFSPAITPSNLMCLKVQTVSIAFRLSVLPGVERLKAGAA